VAGGGGGIGVGVEPLTQLSAIAFQQKAEASPPGPVPRFDIKKIPVNP